MQISGNQYGQLAVQRGLDQQSQAASKVAQGSTTNAASDQPQASSLEEGLLALPQSKILVQAGAKVIETSDAMIGTLLDVKA